MKLKYQNGERMRVGQLPWEEFDTNGVVKPVSGSEL
jgi:hypothetical protein